MLKCLFSILILSILISCVIPEYNLNKEDAIIEAKNIIKTKTGHTSLSKFQFRYLKTETDGKLLIGYCNFAIAGISQPIINIDPNYWRLASDNMKLRIALHELGHCEFGLLHAMNKPFRIMYYDMFDLDISERQWEHFLKFIEHCGDPMASVNGRGFVPSRIEDMCLE